MKIKPTIAAAFATAAVGSASLFGVSAVHAQSGTGGDMSVIDKIAAKFSLDRNEVAQVFEEAHAERKAANQADMSERLQAKVDDGTITADQKSAIEAKLAELDTKRETLKDQDLTREEMREQMEAARTELESWAEEQGMPLNEIMPLLKPGKNSRGGHMHAREGLDHMQTDDGKDGNTDDTGSEELSASDASGESAPTGA